jgi:hypothetical protein
MARNLHSTAYFKGGFFHLPFADKNVYVLGGDNSLLLNQSTHVISLAYLWLNQEG